VLLIGNSGIILPMTILTEIASDDVLEEAYACLCRRRREYSANADVWSLRRYWSQEKNDSKGYRKLGFAGEV